MKKITFKILITFLIVYSTLITACSNNLPKEKSEYTRFSQSFFDTFNTLTIVVAYTKTEEEFNNYFQIIHNRFKELHMLYDIYNDYEGINNLKTINDNAGIKPVEVHEDIISLVSFSIEWANKTYGNTNIALGPVTNIWHQYRSDGLYDPENAKIPPIELLQQKAQLTDINKVIVDKENRTVFLKEKGMSLDVGAIAKGYAVELVAKELEAIGLKSAVISAGGNVRTIGKPLDGIREYWGIGIFDPNSTLFSEDRNLDTVFINNGSVVSSGDYQRYYYVDGELYHHLIDPKTLMPAKYYRAVTVVHPCSAIADFFSSELFFIPFEESYQLAKNFNIEAIWVMPDGEVRVTEGLKKILASYGASGGKQK
ncbi:FAD:protein FMN transferase [Anaerobranca gottschalkii]|uniref:FAD:protein FMN transferase n=1 Tax=Anaerobranca gottschalkii DSM 13577 TaxID=1120990 RepID=A0A1H9YPT1_9FIRM|nr:FAD:protein FMN transferase [Anaerobranca gottschalkii]SES71099.1 thiamine biosynthesis lipoprotein [Anaerobranca gottschalkii DSM 13577]